MSSGDEPPIGATQWSSSPGESMEEMMERLGTLSGEEPESPHGAWDDVTDEATAHSETLRSTLDAQQQAQEMLEYAAKARTEATAQGEQILLEARAMANRLAGEAEEHVQRTRRETKAWAADQRRAVQELIDELKTAADRDAEKVRADARDTAQAEAEEDAARYVARVTAAGAKDAEQLRQQARDVLAVSTGMLGQAQMAIAQFADDAGSFVVGLQRRVDEMEAVLADHDIAAVPPSTAPEELSDDEVAEIMEEPATGDDAASEDAAEGEPTDDEDVDEADAPSDSDSEDETKQ